jgi:transcription elongation factor SPT5
MLDQDFGSDEEDDDFNPAPAYESDNEDARVSIKVSLSGNGQWH